MRPDALNDVELELTAMIDEEGLSGEWTAEVANQRCRRYAYLVGLLETFNQ